MEIRLVKSIKMDFWNLGQIPKNEPEDDDKWFSSYSTWTVSMYQWRVHSRAVVFHTLHRGQGYTILCPYLVSSATFYYLHLSQTRSLPLSPLSLFHPIPVRFCRRRCRLPCPCQVKSCLLPQPHLHLCLRCPLRTFTQSQKWSRSYELRNHILTYPNVLFHRLKSRLLPCRRCRCVFQFTTCLLPLETPRK